MEVEKEKTRKLLQIPNDYEYLQMQAHHTVEKTIMVTPLNFKKKSVMKKRKERSVKKENFYS